MTDVKTKPVEAVAPSVEESIDMVLASVPGAPSFTEVLESLERPEPQPTLVEAVREVEQQLLDRSTRVLADSLRFYEVEEDSEVEDADGNVTTVKQVPPKEWVEELGEEEAQRRLRIAQYAQRSTRNAPVGTHLARDLFLGILGIQARRQESEAPKTVNVQLTQINVSTPPKWAERELLPIKKRR